tara:strand:+ start:315174 stop:316151 length:978 start_codon:yes stop_codon:yes gene_type:complete
MSDLIIPRWRTDPTPADKVLIARGKWIDTDRGDRAVLYKIYQPAPIEGMEQSDKKLPVIIWSHGLGGTRDGAGFVARYLASFGYIIVHIQHHGTDSSLWEGKAGHPWDNIRAAKIPRKAALQRYQDVPFAIRCLKTAKNIDDTLYQRMDFDNMGMSGHSFGAGTSQIMAGQTLGRGKRLYQYKQEDFKAGIIYSPIPSFNRQDDAAVVYGAIDIPLFHMTGTDDGSPLDNTGYEPRLEVYEAIDKADQHLFVLEDGDHMIYSGSRGQLGASDNRERHEELILISSLAFWDSYLRHDKNALHWLTGDGFDTYLASDGYYKFKEKTR